MKRARPEKALTGWLPDEIQGYAQLFPPYVYKTTPLGLRRCGQGAFASFVKCIKCGHGCFVTPGKLNE